MKHNKLHEIAKIAAGLVLGDFIVWLWLASSSVLPTTIWGVTVDQSMVAPALIFDLAIFIILIHYGWNLGKTPTLKRKSYFMFVGVLLGLVALFHLYRVFTGIDANIAGWDVPIWLSWIGTIVTAYLSYMSFRLVIKE